MKTTETIRCQSCGSSSIINLNNGTGQCEHCKSTIILPKEKSEIIALLNSAYVYRESYNYDLAIKTYEYALEKDPLELSAYEGIILSEYGIEYVKDPHTSKLVPTCHRAHFKNVFDNEYYQAFLKIANEDQVNSLSKRLEEINILQEAIERQLKNEQEFDVFISYKATDENGDRTEDSLIAHEIYDELTKKNYRVFFSEKTLENRIGSEYEPIIFKALHTSKIFILVGTKKEYIESTWVRNEWSRFIDRIKSQDESVGTSSFIPVFKDISPYDMPKVNNQFIQGVDASKIGYVVTIADGVQRLLKPPEEQNIINAFDNIENFEEFQKIQKQKTKEIKNNNWKDIQTNPKKKLKKLLYYTLLCLPLLFWIPALIMLFTPHYWLKVNKVVLLTPAIISTAIVMIINLCKYRIHLITHIILPFIISILLIICHIVSNYVVPLTITGKTAEEFGSWSYSKGLYYSELKNEVHIHNFKSLKDLNKYNYIYEKNGVVYFELPNEFNGKPITYVYFEQIPDEVEILIIPKYFDRIYSTPEITVRKTSKLKTIISENIIDISIIDIDEVIGNPITYFNFKFNSDHLSITHYVRLNDAYGTLNPIGYYTLEKNPIT